MVETPKEPRSSDAVRSAAAPGDAAGMQAGLTSAGLTQIGLMTGPKPERERHGSEATEEAASGYRRFIPFGGSLAINLLLVAVLGLAVRVSFVVPVLDGELLLPVTIVSADALFPDEIRDRAPRAEEAIPPERLEDEEALPSPEEETQAEDETEPETPDAPEDAAADERDQPILPPEDPLLPDDPLLQGREARINGEGGDDEVTKSAREAALEGPDTGSDLVPDKAIEARPKNRAELDALFEQIYGRRPSDVALPAVEAAKELEKEDPYAELSGPEIDALFRQRNLPSVDLPAQQRAGAEGDDTAGIIAIYCNRVFSDNPDKAAECAGRPEILSGWVDDGTYQALIRQNLAESGADPDRYGPGEAGRRAVTRRAAQQAAEDRAVTRDALGAFEAVANEAAAQAATPEDENKITNFDGAARKGAQNASDDPFGIGASPIPQRSFEPGWAVRHSQQEEEIERIIKEDRGE